MSDNASKTPDATKPRRGTIFASALLLIALAMVVIYTNRGAFISPLAMVVVAAIGMAALLLQLRLRPASGHPVQAPMWLNILGLLFALAAVFADVLRLTAALALAAALGAVLSFGVSGAFVLRVLRRPKL